MLDVQVLVVKKQSLQQDQKAVPNIAFLREAALVFFPTSTFFEFYEARKGLVIALFWPMLMICCAGAEE